MEDNTKWLYTFTDAPKYKIIKVKVIAEVYDIDEYLYYKYIYNDKYFTINKFWFYDTKEKAVIGLSKYIDYRLRIIYADMQIIKNDCIDSKKIKNKLLKNYIKLRKLYYNLDFKEGYMYVQSSMLRYDKYKIVNHKIKRFWGLQACKFNMYDSEYSKRQAFISYYNKRNNLYNKIQIENDKIFEITSEWTEYNGEFQSLKRLFHSLKSYLKNTK